MVIVTFVAPSTRTPMDVKLFMSPGCSQLVGDARVYLNAWQRCPPRPCAVTRELLCERRHELDLGLPSSACSHA